MGYSLYLQWCSHHMALFLLYFVGVRSSNTICEFFSRSITQFLSELVGLEVLVSLCLSLLLLVFSMALASKRCPSYTCHFQKHSSIGRRRRRRRIAQVNQNMMVFTPHLSTHITSIKDSCQVSSQAVEILLFHHLSPKKEEIE